MYSRKDQGVNNHPELLCELASFKMRVSFVTFDWLPACIAEIKLIEQFELEVSEKQKTQPNTMLLLKSSPETGNKLDATKEFWAIKNKHARQEGSFLGKKTVRQQCQVLGLTLQNICNACGDHC